MEPTSGTDSPREQYDLGFDDGYEMGWECGYQIGYAEGVDSMEVGDGYFQTRKERKASQGS